MIAHLFAQNLNEPVFLTAPHGDTERVFVVERTGAIRILDRATGRARPQPFLNQTGLATAFNEQGLLCLGFHPLYADNGLFFVYFTAADRAINIVRYKVSEDPDHADAGSGIQVLRIPKRQDGQFLNHNGGWLGFRPTDGFLYIAVGDGGPLTGRDPDRHGQDRGTLLGKLLRIDVDRDDSPSDAQRSYGIPAKNPFVNDASARKEIWAYGLRNPWRCSFDRETGDLFIGDVGQSRREEVNFELAGSRGGRNYGWRAKEGTLVTALEPTLPAGLTDPIYEYDHNSGGVAIIGGYVYRGQAIPELRGKYLFADHEGSIFSLSRNGDAVDVADLSTSLFPQGTPNNISSFGEDASGELYLLTLDQGIFKFSLADIPRLQPMVRGIATGRDIPRSCLRALKWQRTEHIARLRAPEMEGVTPPTVGPQARAHRAMIDALEKGALVPMLPKDMSARDQAVFLLRSAAEVEHALMVQYLFAWFSINEGSAFNASLLFPMFAPKDILLGLAIEEMGHLMTVQNLLISLGASPHFDLESENPDPEQVTLYPFPVRLERISKGALGKYVIAESPSLLPADFPAEARAQLEVARQAAEANLAASGVNGPVVHVGGIYAKLIRIFSEPGSTAELKELDTMMQVVHLKEGDFVGNASGLQEDPELWTDHHGSAFFIRNAETQLQVVQALKDIAEQGEGWDSPAADEPGGETHFERFLALFNAFVQNPTGAVLPVAVNPGISDDATPLPDGLTPITSTTAVPVARLFLCRYEMLLLTLAYLLSVPPGIKRDGLRGAALNGMRKGIKEIGNALLQFPLMDGAPQPVAGPPFRLPHALPVSPEEQKSRLLALIARSEELITAIGSFTNLRAANNQLISLLNQP